MKTEQQIKEMLLDYRQRVLGTSGQKGCRFNRGRAKGVVQALEWVLDERELP